MYNVRWREDAFREPCCHTKNRACGEGANCLVACGSITNSFDGVLFGRSLVTLLLHLCWVEKSMGLRQHVDELLVEFERWAEDLNKAEKESRDKASTELEALLSQVDGDTSYSRSVDWEAFHKFKNEVERLLPIPKEIEETLAVKERLTHEIGLLKDEAEVWSAVQSLSEQEAALERNLKSKSPDLVQAAATLPDVMDIYEDLLAKHLQYGFSSEKSFKEDLREMHSDRLRTLKFTIVSLCSSKWESNLRIYKDPQEHVCISLQDSQLADNLMTCFVNLDMAEHLVEQILTSVTDLVFKSQDMVPETTEGECPYIWVSEKIPSDPVDLMHLWRACLSELDSHVFNHPAVKRLFAFSACNETARQLRRLAPHVEEVAQQNTDVPLAEAVDCMIRAHLGHLILEQKSQLVLCALDTVFVSASEDSIVVVPASLPASSVLLTSGRANIESRHFDTMEALSQQAHEVWKAQIHPTNPFRLPEPSKELQITVETLHLGTSLCNFWDTASQLEPFDEGLKLFQEVYRKAIASVLCLRTSQIEGKVTSKEPDLLAAVVIAEVLYLGTLNARLQIASLQLCAKNLFASVGGLLEEKLVELTESILMTTKAALTEMYPQGLILECILDENVALENQIKLAECSRKLIKIGRVYLDVMPESTAVELLGFYIDVMCSQFIQKFWNAVEAIITVHKRTNAKAQASLDRMSNAWMRNAPLVETIHSAVQDTGKVLKREAFRSSHSRMDERLIRLATEVSEKSGGLQANDMINLVEFHIHECEQLLLQLERAESLTSQVKGLNVLKSIQAAIVHAPTDTTYLSKEEFSKLEQLEDAWLG
eukprot:Blabericola_migrator_1__2795@NODE_17_length_22983_cov_74_609923_g14_i0_p3_GENE_NODE_17_length_22983_cov_74_609923_g14_i0NODE_17_length_22983_cov_74_609923_g14_i0_p3_ORF_typecomplete_len825_score155_84PDDEXK_6/PF04720_12/0_025SLATT_1/PF18181_1/39SLATT_1/PF18181_1/72SLATT_1/PF18181_1/4e02SLATT_1/PF18181_1/2_9e03Seryl_tRNA_N/PF02403_22/4_4e02Seryl_tRNA_N/PF02403_22/3_2_NODE_17_length_22983_cov_74_609923_g14_i01158314057